MAAKKKNDRHRGILVTTRLSAVEKKQIEQEAKDAARSVSQHIWFRLFGGKNGNAQN